MKILQFICLAVVMAFMLSPVIPSEAEAQTKKNDVPYEGGKAYSWYDRDVDSLETSYTDAFDISGMDATQPTLAYNYKSNTSNADSLRLILEGLMEVDTAIGDANRYIQVWYPLDTNIIFGSLSDSARSLQFTMTSWSGKVRIRYSQVTGGAATNANLNNATLALWIYNKSYDVILPEGRIIWR